MKFKAALQYLEEKSDVLKMKYEKGIWSIYCCKQNEHLDPDTCKYKTEISHDWDGTEGDNINEALHKLVISTQKVFQIAEEDLVDENTE